MNGTQVRWSIRSPGPIVDEALGSRTRDGVIVADVHGNHKYGVARISMPVDGGAGGSGGGTTIGGGDMTVCCAAAGWMPNPASKATNAAKQNAGELRLLW